jgi:hypothetical protein
MEHIVELVPFKEVIDEDGVCYVAPLEQTSTRYVVQKTTGEVVDHNHLVTHRHEMLGDVGPYESSATGY